VKKGTTKPKCHPGRSHYAKGLCASCYHALAKKKRRKQPVRVTHTHEVIREVQQQEEKHTMPAAHETHEVKAEPLKRAEGASKESVVSLAGTTEPTVELGGDGITPKAEWDKKYSELKKKQDEHDEKRRKQAVEDAGVIQTTEKHGAEKGKHNG
jgi:hypothetical protein